MNVHKNIKSIFLFIYKQLTIERLVKIIFPFSTSLKRKDKAYRNGIFFINCLLYYTVIALERLVKLLNRVIGRLKRNYMNYLTVREGCTQLAQDIKWICTDQSLELSMPKIFNEKSAISAKHKCSGKLPDQYLATLKNATVTGGTDLVIVNNTILYDEIDKQTFNKYGVKSPAIEKITKDSIALHIKAPSSSILCGIHLNKDHSMNYYHWLIECLPRLSLITHLDKNIPLIIDASVSSQALEALDIFNSDNRPIVKLDINEAMLVKKLYYPSQLSIIHDNYGERDFSQDVLISPVAVNFVRNEVFKKLNIVKPKGFRKIYIARKSTYRHLLNQDEIIKTLIEHGFEIIYPEKLTFTQQAHILSQAKVIIGQSGAGMANIIFAPKNCKVLILALDNSIINMHPFQGIADAIGLSLQSLTSTRIDSDETLEDPHSSFKIDNKMLFKYLLTI